MAAAEEFAVQKGVVHVGQPEPALTDVTGEESSLKVAATTESGVNTDADWESRVAQVFSHSSVLKDQLEVVMRQQQQEKERCEKEMQEALREQEAAKQEHMAVLEKLASVRGKLQLNNSKASIKNFLAKKEKMILENNKENETLTRLNAELDESCTKLRDLFKEQLEEKKRWCDELAELKQQLEPLKREAEAAQRVALQDEVAAVEQQRDVAMAQIKDWHKELKQYLTILSQEMPKRFHAERPQWEKKQDLVRQTQTELQSRFQAVLQQLHQGRELDFLSRINVPELPPIPTAELKFDQIRCSLATPLFRVPSSAPPRPPMMFPGLHQPVHPPRPQPFYPPPHRQSLYMPPPPHLFQPLHPQRLHHGADFPPLHQQSKVFSTRPAQATPPPSMTPPPAPSTQAARAADAPADKLEKVLEKLASRFPECTKAQLKSLLRQVKSSRGTLAGMSTEEVVVQVGLRLAKNEGPSPVIGLGPAPQPQPPPPQGFMVETRKLCLMCLNLVDPEQRHPLGCSHTVHRDCIRTWLETSKNNSCPFCQRGTH